MALIFDFEGQIFKKLYHMNKKEDWHKGRESIGSWTQVVTLLPHPRHRQWIFKVKFLIAIFYSWIGRSIDLEWKTCELDTILDAQWVSSWPSVHGK